MCWVGLSLVSVTSLPSRGGMLQIAKGKSLGRQRQRGSDQGWIQLPMDAPAVSPLRLWGAKQPWGNSCLLEPICTDEHHCTQGRWGTAVPYLGTWQCWKPQGQARVLPAVCAWLPARAQAGFYHVDITSLSSQTVSPRSPSPAFPSPPPCRMFRGAVRFLIGE